MKIAAVLSHVLVFLTVPATAKGRPDKQSCSVSANGDSTCVELTTRQSEIDALNDLFVAMHSPEAMENWGDGRDPCAGEKTGDFDAGFAWWKGIACHVCDDDSNHYCVRSTFLHLKGMKGTIPSTFRDFTDLEILLMSGNNITGALPPQMLSSFPKLRRLDLSYNEITGTLPLADLQGLSELRQAFFDNNQFTSISTPATPPFVSGYENLMELNLNYNHPMDALFPVAIAYMPRLTYLKIHDTALYGRLPTHPRAFFNVEMLQISGSHLCGDLPTVCTQVVPGRFDAAFCDMESLNDCTNEYGIVPDESTYPTPPPLRLGAPDRTYGTVTLEVYKQVLTSLGFEIESVTELPHRDLYPLFWENPRTEHTVDIIVTSDLPQNHDTYLEGHHDAFVLAGSSYEKEMITIVVPDITTYDSLSSLSQAADTFSKRVIYTFDEDACPVCEGDAIKWKDSYFPSDFVVTVMSLTDLSTLAETEKTNPEFIVVSWIPHGFNAKYSLHDIDMQDETPLYLNQGKALIRKDSRVKLGPAGLGVLSAVVVPTKDVERMDYAVQSEGGSPAMVAAEWITKYQDIVDMWAWH